MSTLPTCPFTTLVFNVFGSFFNQLNLVPLRLSDILFCLDRSITEMGWLDPQDLRWTKLFFPKHGHFCNLFTLVWSQPDIGQTGKYDLDNKITYFILLVSSWVPTLPTSLPTYINKSTIIIYFCNIGKSNVLF